KRTTAWLLLFSFLVHLFSFVHPRALRLAGVIVAVPLTLRPLRCSRSRRSRNRPMLAILNIIAPVFAIIGVGYLAVRFRLYPTEGVRGLVAFVNNFATPCLLFQAMLTSDFGTTFNWSVIIPFYVGALCCLVGGWFVAARFFG